SASNGQTISGYQNLGQTYVYRSTAGAVTVTGVTSNGQATNNGNPIAGTATFTNPGSVAISSAAWATTGGGTITYTTSAAHGVAPNQVVDITGFSNAAYNASALIVNATPTTTTFTRKGVQISVKTAVWSSANGGTITYGTTGANFIQNGQRVTIFNSSPAA